MLASSEQILQNGWKISPLATAVRLSAFERKQYIAAKHLKLISDAIVDSVTGVDDRFIVISMPPRHGKSWLVSRYTISWFLANWPHLHAMICGYGSMFAKEWGRLTRNDAIKNADLLGFTVAQDSKAADQWHTSIGGGVVTAGIGGGITGKGADLLIIDDPIKNAKEAFSATYRDDVWGWWQTTARTRLHKGGTIIVVMTRWHEDDLAGRLLNDEFSDPTVWREIRLPAVWEDESTDEIGRRKGEALWPAMYDSKALEALKASSDDETWFSLFQQTPLNLTGIGSCYHAYSDELNVKPVVRDPNLPLVLAMDFNVDPMSWLVCQYRHHIRPVHMLASDADFEVDVLDEIILPNSNTPEAAKEFLSRCLKNGWLGYNRTKLQVFGDYAANARNTNGAPSDWALVRQMVGASGMFEAEFNLRPDPPVRDRINAMNRALKSASGERRLFIDPKCKELRKDLREVRWKRDAAGNSTSTIDKTDPKRTHSSDALGYFVHGKFSLKPLGGERPGFVR